MELLGLILLVALIAIFGDTKKSAKSKDKPIRSISGRGPNVRPVGRPRKGEIGHNIPKTPKVKW